MLSAMLLISGLLQFEAADTLQAAVLTAEKSITITREDSLFIHPVGNISDLLMQSPGVAISDNGGDAGLKTFNLRGLGSPNTSIFIDGLKVTDIQSGTPDGGMLPLETFSGAIIDYAQNSINFRTRRPDFRIRKDGSYASISGQAGLSGGSFGALLPKAGIDLRLSEKTAMSINAAGTFSKGDYPYPDPLNEGAVLRRENNDLSQFRTGINLFGTGAGSDWMAKAYFNTADRGTPGPLSWPSADRQKNNNSFVQGHFQKAINNRYSVAFVGKLAYDYINYNSYLGQDEQSIDKWYLSEYKQSNFQFSNSHNVKLTDWLKLSGVLNCQWDGLNATDYNAKRLELAGIAGASLHWKRFLGDLTLEYNGYFDNGVYKKYLSPAASLKVNATDNLLFSGFIRKAHRTPTFNELYYPGYGNPELRPENAILSDIGIDYHRSISPEWKIKAQLDLFYNYLKDKISSAPNPENPSLWLPYNIGEVNSRGADAAFGAAYDSNGWDLAMDVRYSLQEAENVPYLSKHSIVSNIRVSFSGWGLDLAGNWRGGRRDSYGDMPDWYRIDLIISKIISLGEHLDLSFILSCRNITNHRYELVSGYPMQGRDLNGGIEIKF